jgi:signal transduction histidine kinase
MENVQLYQTLERRVAARTHELTQSRAELAREHAALQRVQRQKEELAALLAHDLKSPASGIMLSCQARLRRGDLPDSERRSFRRIYAGAEVITRTASNLIDVTHNEDGTFHVVREVFDLRRLLDESVELSAPLLEGRGQRLELTYRADDAPMSGDREVLRRVLQNLIDNAVQHAPARSVIRLEARSLRDQVALRISDEGPGVPAADRERIFEKYVRLHRHANGPHHGHGLGLSFCRLAAQHHGGAIWVEPNQPRGSVFVLQLPRIQSTSAR